MWDPGFVNYDFRPPLPMPLSSLNELIPAFIRHPMVLFREIKEELCPIEPWLFVPIAAPLSSICIGLGLGFLDLP